MLDTTTIQTEAPLEALYVHSFNPRSDRPDSDAEADDIRALAGSIAAAGLQYPLACLRTEENFGVVDGRRRLLALQHLATHPELDPDAVATRPIPLRITDDADTARAWALIPATTTMRLHPADEIRAFATQAAQGTTPDEIARIYVLTARLVKGRLRLASLPDMALDALREDRISLDTAQALTLAPDRDRQLAVTESLLANPARLHDPAGWVRRELADGAVPATDRRARFVTVALYQAEGGTLTEDLFGDHTILHDEALLDRLFARELEHRAEQARETEGWAWAERCPDSSIWQMTDKLTRLWPTPGELSDADRDELEHLSELADGGTLDPDSTARLEELDARDQGDFTDEDRATGGIICHVNYDGEFVINRAFARPGDLARANTDDSDDAGDGPAPEPATAKPAVSRAATEDLHRIRLLALQTAALTKGDLLLDLLAFALESGASPTTRPFAIQLDAPQILPERDSGLLPDARLTETTLISDWQADTSAEAFARFRELGKKHRNTVLTTALARAIQPGSMWQLLWQLMTPDVRATWTPDAANLFAHMRSDALDALWADLTGLETDAPEMAEFVKSKKGEKAKQLERLFSDASLRETLGLSRDQNARIDAWLPDVMAVPEGEA